MGDISKDIKSKFKNHKVKALINIKYTANWLYSKEIEYFKPYGISPQQYNILRILRGAGEPTKVQIIKERMIERAPNATRLMDKLCAKNLIERFRCDEDRRVVYVKIAAPGLSLLDNVDMDSVSGLLNPLSNEEAKELNRLLDKIR